MNRAGIPLVKTRQVQTFISYYTSSFSNVLRMTATAAWFRVSRIFLNCSGEKRQCLYWEDASYMERGWDSWQLDCNVLWPFEGFEFWVCCPLEEITLWGVVTVIVVDVVSGLVCAVTIVTICVPLKSASLQCTFDLNLNLHDIPRNASADRWIKFYYYVSERRTGNGHHQGCGTGCVRMDALQRK